MCPAEQMGKASVFLMVANLLQKFNFKVPPGTANPSDLPVVGLGLSPEPFDVFIERRYTSDV
jgi:hypothetical protein